MPKAKVGFRNGQAIHYSVGAIVSNKGKILLIDRKQPPFGLAGPAGHIDANESPLQALKREVKEETGLNVLGSELVAKEFVTWNECSYGVTSHYWYVYKVSAAGKITLDTHEAKTIDWYDIKHAKNLEPVWRYWFKKLGEL